MTIDVVCNSQTVHSKDADGAFTIMVQFNAVDGLGSYHYYLSATDAAAYVLGTTYTLTLSPKA